MDSHAPQTIVPPRAYTIAHTAELLGVSKRTVYRLIGAGRLGVVKIGTRRMRVPERELARLLDVRGADP
jgi:excisionase family DNA binding protein